MNRPWPQNCVRLNFVTGINLPKPLLLFVLALVLLSSSTALADDVVPTSEVTNRVVVRAGPSAQTADVGSLQLGEKAELLGSVPSWYRVRLSNGTEGFVAKRWTRIVSVAAPAVAAASFTIDAVDVGTGLGILVRGPDFALIYDAGSNDDLALIWGRYILFSIMSRGQQRVMNFCSCTTIPTTGQEFRVKGW
jgi:beta-lactamase superfamily II metal-dependent hydrolase